MTWQLGVTVVVQVGSFHTGTKLALVNTVAGKPLWKMARLLACQPPKMARTGRPRLLKDGRSATKFKATFCRMSFGDNPRCAGTLYASITSAYTAPDPGPTAFTKSMALPSVYDVWKV